mgnify:CR=1 FL=1
MLSPDSLIYRTLTDSSGRFSLGPLPRGDYAVYAAIDQNHNLRRERRENYDSAAAASGTLLVPPLWLLPRDTLGPRIQGIAPHDANIRRQPVAVATGKAFRGDRIALFRKRQDCGNTRRLGR